MVNGEWGKREGERERERERKREREREREMLGQGVCGETRTLRVGVGAGSTRGAL